MQPDWHCGRPQVGPSAANGSSAPDLPGAAATLNCFSSFFEPHSGQIGFSCEFRTNISTLLSQELHWYSYKGIYGNSERELRLIPVLIVDSARNEPSVIKRYNGPIRHFPSLATSATSASIVPLSEHAENMSPPTPWQQLSSSVMTTEQVRKVDRLAIDEFRMNSLVLMENAALGCVQWLLNHFKRPMRTAILCGRGNNGGDGLAIARHLQLQGWRCNVVLLGPIEQLSDDNRSNLEVLTSGRSENADDDLSIALQEHAPAESLHEIQNAELVIDAMLGSGASGDPRPPFSEWIQAANASHAFRLAIDIPTGISAEDGEQGDPYFRADATLTFVARKPAMDRPDSKQLFGLIKVLPIGVPQRLIQRLLSEQE